MQSNYRERLEQARRRRRLRWIFPSLLVAGFSAGSLLADQGVQPAVKSPSFSGNAAPVLKSVGIKFRDNAPAPNTLTTSELPIPRLVAASAGSVEARKAEAVPTPKADMKMPPLIAGQAPEIKTPSVAPGKVVSIEMRPTLPMSNPAGKLTIQSPAQIPTPSPTPKIEQPSPTGSAVTPKLALQDTVPKTVSNSIESTAPTTAETPHAKADFVVSKPTEPTKIAMQPSPAPETPKPAPIGSSTEAKPENPAATTSRAPEIVRIPSMTLVGKKDAVSAGSPPSPAASTPSVRSPLSVPAPKALADSTPKLEHPSREIAKSPTSSTTPGSISGKLTDLPSPPPAKPIVAHEATHEVPSLKLPEPPARVAMPVRTPSQPEATVVALPASNVHSIIPRESKEDRLTGPGSNPILSNAAPTKASENESTVKSIDVVHRTVRSLDIGRPIGRIDILDETVCKAMPTESTSVILMGISKGTTTVTVWPEAGQHRSGRPERFEVTVRDAWSNETNESRNVNAISEAEQSLAQMFPDAEISLKSNAGGGLAIVGKVASKEEAKQIAQLVRKMFLVPVLDRVAVASP